MPESCKVCKEKTSVIFNIKLEATPVCEECATAIFIQQAQWYTNKSPEPDTIYRIPDGEYFFEQRKALRLTTKEVMRRTGISSSTVTRIEMGQSASYTKTKELYLFYENEKNREGN